MNDVTQLALSGALPLYQAAHAVHAERHAARAITPDRGDYRFAAASTLVPITVDEFERAALDYPLVFVGDDHRAFAVTGIKPDSNAFVEADGRYRTGAYIPAYLRRHPFVFATTDDGVYRLLCIDEASDRLVDADKAEALRLFDDGQPSATTREAIAFCQAFEEADSRTRLLAELLVELDLLQPREATFVPAGAETVARELLLAYAIPSREKLAALDDAAFARLRSAGALPAIYAMLAAEPQWGVLGL